LTFRSDCVKLRVLYERHTFQTEMPNELQQVEFSSRVPKSDYDEFVGNFPVHGAVSWFIRSALKEFNKQCRAEPSTIERIREAIVEVMKEPSAL
jgi:hypothetical protein